MFMAIMNDDDDAEAQLQSGDDYTDDTSSLSLSRGGGKHSRWHRYQYAALSKIADEELRDDDDDDDNTLGGRRELKRYRFRDHLRVALRSSLESLVLFPFWAIKVYKNNINIYHNKCHSSSDYFTLLSSSSSLPPPLPPSMLMLE
jgi:hypothetical protein